ncbi:amidohydrolase [Gemmobacter lutimaris]|uniref:Amidohydrolase n=1 Tax=Gemmobacter lutimaris TaxID=2306023 RepID=A0A398C2C7_9RHOB|nr:amidohydrolase [Gemmobacter lutimaris]RID93516.1 amidohydrolase [Gemmobacter lutimaris]
MDLVIRNARSFPDGAAVALAVQDGLIAWIGPDGEAPATTQIIDAGGATLLPAFTESHVHLFLGGTALGQLNLAAIGDTASFRSALRHFADSLSPGAFLCGYAANYEMLGPGTRPDRHALDAAVADRPVFITSTDYHAAWANTAALQLAGILHGAETPPGAEVVMGPDGLATGELREGAAMELIRRLTPTGGRDSTAMIGQEPPGTPDAAMRARDKATILRACHELARHGITNAVNMDGNLYQAGLFTELAEELPIRVKLPMNLTEDQDDARVAALITQAQAAPVGRLEFGMIKMFMDGVYDTWTAHVVGGYPDDPANDGPRLISAPAFARLCTMADAAGLQIAVHAVGDGAVRAVLDGYEAARTANGPRDSRHRIEHIDTITEADLPRLRTLGVMASMQPVHPPGSAGLPLEPTISIMGRARWPTAFPWARIASQGTPLAFGTDWPVSPLDPLYCLHCALSRRPWAADMPDQRLDLAAALAAYSAGGAYGMFAEARRGALRPGMQADVILVAGDLTALADCADAARVTLTLREGEIIWQA